MEKPHFILNKKWESAAIYFVFVTNIEKHHTLQYHSNNQVPLIFFNLQSRFNKTFDNVEMFVVLSSSSYLDAIEMSIRLNMPLLLLVCNQKDSWQLAKFKKILEDYQIGHLLNQSFLTAGLHFQQREFKKYVGESGINQAGLYAFRKNLIEKMEKYAQFLLRDVPTLPDDTINTIDTVQKMKKIRRMYYQKRREDQNILDLDKQ